MLRLTEEPTIDPTVLEKAVRQHPMARPFGNKLEHGSKIYAAIEAYLTGEMLYKQWIAHAESLRAEREVVAQAGIVTPFSDYRAVARTPDLLYAIDRVITATMDRAAQVRRPQDPKQFLRPHMRRDKLMHTWYQVETLRSEADTDWSMHHTLLQHYERCCFKWIEKAGKNFLQPLDIVSAETQRILL